MIEAAACADQTESVDTSSRDSQLNRRCALFTLLALTLSIGAGLLAWGPVLLHATTHNYADARPLFGVANGASAAFSLPMLLAGAWGWRALGRSVWPASLQRPWQLYFGCITLAGGLSAAYHLAPNDFGFLLAQATAAGAFVMLLCGVLAERMDARFGTPRACAAVLATVVLATGVSSLGAAADLRPLLMLQLLPVLLIPAGALSLRGRHTRRADWLLMLSLYALARVFDWGDAAVMRLTGGALSGHALMHLCLAGVVAWLAYRAGAATASPVAAESGGLAQASTSLSTSG